MTIYGYPKEKFDPKFLDALMTAEQLFLKDTQSYSLKRDLTTNEVLSSEYKRAFIKMPESNYDGGLIFSFNEEVKKQGKDNVLFTPLRTADESRAAFDSLREDYKEKLKTEFEKRGIAYDKDLINALSSRDSHRISMAIAQNGLIEKETPITLNNNVSVKTPEVARPTIGNSDMNSKVSPEQKEKMKQFLNTQLEGTTPDNLKRLYIDGHKGDEAPTVAFEEITKEKREEAIRKLDDVAVSAKHTNSITAESLNINLDAHKRELVDYLDHMDRTMNYYSMSAQGGRPRNDCSTLVGNSLAVEFGRGDYPKSSWAALQGIIGPEGSRCNSEKMIKDLARVAGDMIVGKNLHSMESQQDRRNVLLNMIREVGHGGVIATDKGKTSFDQDRALGVDHIVRVVEKNGQLYIYETESPNGTHMTPAEEWAEKKSKIRDKPNDPNRGLNMVENFYAVRGKDLRDGMASGEFIKDGKLREATISSAKEGFIDDLKIFAANNHIDPRVAAAYLKYNDSYEKFAEAVKNIDDNPAATWKKMQEYAQKQAKEMGVDYHFDKNDGLIAKIFALFGKMLADGANEQTMSSNAPYHTPEAKIMTQNEQANVESGGVRESNPNITSKTITEAEGLDLSKLANNNEHTNNGEHNIKDFTTTANGVSF